MRQPAQASTSAGGFARLVALLAAPVLLSCGGGGGDGGTVELPQTVTLTAPANLADGLAGTVTLTATAAANAGIVAVEFQVDGAAAGAEDANAPYSTTIDTNQWASGQHVLRARGRDAAGNRTAWSSAVVRFGGGRNVPAGFSLNEGWVTGLASAAAFAQAPDGRLFVAEQGGNLRVVKNGVLLGSPFVSLTVDASGERGLIGVATHPNFASNHFVYVYYTRINGGARNNRISRFVATGDVVAGPETVIIDLPDLSTFATNHNGGGMKFGPDGKLYVGVGDNGNGALAQNLGHPFGKMLRLNDDGSVPGDNPYANTQTGQGRFVWAYGLRNPFTFAIQPGTGRMHINDVGEQTWEEINLGAPGANYGWPASEGPANVTTGVTAPLFAYGHDPAVPAGSGPGGFFIGQAIAGGAFYPTSGAGLFPAPYRGQYFFADFLDRFIGVLDTANGNAAYAFGSVSGRPVDMLVGSDGALHVLTRDAIARISPP
ncbi:MAG: PQQ-dependent sugar dehydrogenase [Burkholderiales bacterium]|nr:PQQ-dependent sugar dehydrogenase [Burkholderiales bacterium]